MKHEDVWGSLDERWRGKEPAVGWRRLKRPLLRVGAVVLLLLLLGEGYVETGFSLRISTLIDEAVRECRDRENALSEHNCAPAVWEACHAEYPSAELGVSNGLDNQEFFTETYLCEAAQLAELAELASVLAAKYGTRYYQSQSPAQEFYWMQSIMDVRDFYFSERLTKRHAGEDPLFPPNRRFYTRFFDLSRRTYLPETTLEKIKPQLLNSNNHLRKFHILTDARRNYLKPLRGAVMSLDWRNEPESTRKTSENLKLPTLKETYTKQTILRRSMEFSDIEQLCYFARNSLREHYTDAIPALDQCQLAAQDCQLNNTQHAEYCLGAAYTARLEHLWQQLPAVCAEADDITTTRTDDTCRRAARYICELPHNSPRPGIGEPFTTGFILMISCSLAIYNPETCFHATFSLSPQDILAPYQCEAYEWQA